MTPAELTSLRGWDVFIGVDPGSTGGVAIVAARGRQRRVRLYSLANRTDHQIWDIFSVWVGRTSWCPAYVVVEHVQGYIGGMEVDGRQERGRGPQGSSMFKFGRSAGFLHGCLTAAGLPFDRVAPHKWQRGLGIPPRNHQAGETKSQWKARLRQHAAHLFPQEKVTRAVADALLIAEYGRRLHRREEIAS